VRVGVCLTSRSSPGRRLWRQLASRGIGRGKETVQGVWIEEYYKPMQEALKKAAQVASAVL
jgi:hypothetical protein